MRILPDVAIMSGVSSNSWLSEYNTSHGLVVVPPGERMEFEMRVLAGTIHNGLYGADLFEDMNKLSLLFNATSYGIKPANIVEYCRRLMKGPIDDPVECVGVTWRKNASINKQVPAMFTDAALFEREPDIIKDYYLGFADCELQEKEWRDVAGHITENSSWYYGGEGVTCTYVPRSQTTAEVFIKADAYRQTKKGRKVSKAVAESHELLTQSEKSEPTKVVEAGSNQNDWIVQCVGQIGKSRCKREAEMIARIKHAIDRAYDGLSTLTSRSRASPRENIKRKLKQGRARE